MNPYTCLARTFSSQRESQILEFSFGLKVVPNIKKFRTKFESEAKNCSKWCCFYIIKILGKELVARFFYKERIKTEEKPSNPSILIKEFSFNETQTALTLSEELARSMIGKKEMERK